MTRPILILTHVAVYTSLCALLWPGNGAWTLPVIGAVLIWISLHDLEHMEIPDSATAVLCVLALVELWRMPPMYRMEHVIAGLLWPLLFLGASALFRLRHARTGLGLGDVKLMLPLGLLCGIVGTVHVVLAASMSAVITLGVLAWRAGTAPQGQAIPFGPFLCLAGWAIWLNLGG